MTPVTMTWKICLKVKSRSTRDLMGLGLGLELGLGLGPGLG